MANLPPCFEAMLAAWNEKDPSRIRGHLDAALAPDVTFCDPKYNIQGIDAFETMVREFHIQYKVSTCERTSGIDFHHHLYRYTWLVSVNGKPAIPGMDVVAVDDQNRIKRVDGFFGPFPALG